MMQTSPLILCAPLSGCLPGRGAAGLATSGFPAHCRRARVLAGQDAASLPIAAGRGAPAARSADCPTPRPVTRERCRLRVPVAVHRVNCRACRRAGHSGSVADASGHCRQGLPRRAGQRRCFPAPLPPGRAPGKIGRGRSHGNVARASGPLPTCRACRRAGHSGSIAGLPACRRASTSGRATSGFPAPLPPGRCRRWPLLVPGVIRRGHCPARSAGPVTRGSVAGPGCCRPIAPSRPRGAADVPRCRPVADVLPGCCRPRGPVPRPRLVTRGALPGPACRRLRSAPRPGPGLNVLRCRPVADGLPVCCRPVNSRPVQLPAGHSGSVAGPTCCTVKIGPTLPAPRCSRRADAAGRLPTCCPVLPARHCGKRSSRKRARGCLARANLPTCQTPAACRAWGIDSQEEGT